MTRSNRSRPSIAAHPTGRPARADAVRTSKTRLDLPLPDTPVTAVRTPDGISTSIERRLFAEAPVIRIPGPGRSGKGSRAGRPVAPGSGRSATPGSAAISSGASFGHDPAAVRSGPRAHVDEPVRRPDDVDIVLDDDDRIPPAGHVLEHGDEAVRIAGVESDGGLVQDVGDSGETGPELAGKPQAPGFSSRQRRRPPVDGQVIQARRRARGKAAGVSPSGGLPSRPWLSARPCLEAVPRPSKKLDASRTVRAESSAMFMPGELDGERGGLQARAAAGRAGFFLHEREHRLAAVIGVLALVLLGHEVREALPRSA